MGKIPILEVVKLLNMEPRPGAVLSSLTTSANFRCPLCGHKGYTLNVNFSKDAFKCPKCGTKGGAVALYAAVRFGEPYTPRTSRAKEITTALYEELNGSEQEIQHKRIRPAQPLPLVIPPAPDSMKNAVYSAIMDLPYLKLSAKHQENLLKRGISLNRLQNYRTIPANWNGSVVTAPDFEEKLRGLPVRVPKEMALLGLRVIQDLQAAGFSDFKGIPGMFKIGSQWCFYMTPGMLIPTKNEKRQIVCFQIRKDYGSLRYMTLSNKLLPSSVQDGIARYHVTSNLKKGQKEFKVLLTEGPLKADVIASLSRDPVVVIAIQGINVTSCLDPILEWLKSNDVKKIYCCLDMDRITNKNVRSGSVALRKLLMSRGFKFPAMCWDQDTAIAKIEEMKMLALEHDIPLPPKTGNAYTYLASLCISLEEHEIEHSKKHDYWPDRSKGYDDWLLTLRKQEAVRQNGHPLP
ncbi:MAG: hypothetical protein II038_14170 [Lachnospiraceae bacterium]|nr:hypothetical protein [Lachnospiraceae bacterium]